MWLTSSRGAFYKCTILCTPQLVRLWLRMTFQCQFNTSSICACIPSSPSIRPWSSMLKFKPSLLQPRIHRLYFPFGVMPPSLTFPLPRLCRRFRPCRPFSFRSYTLVLVNAFCWQCSTARFSSPNPIGWLEPFSSRVIDLCFSSDRGDALSPRSIQTNKIAYIFQFFDLHNSHTVWTLSSLSRYVRNNFQL